MNSTRRRQLLLGACALAALPSPGRAQGRVRRIGYLGYTSAGSESVALDALRAGLRELGYVEGANLVIEYRFADGDLDRLPRLARELVQARVDLIVTWASPAVRAAKAASATLPIVMTASADAVATGLVDSLARPGGNVTGLTILSPELAVKRLELLKEALPRIARVAVLVRTGNPANDLVLPAAERTAASLQLALRRFAVTGPAEFDGAFADMVQAGMDAVLLTDDPLLTLHAPAFAGIAATRRLPAAYTTIFADAGGLIGFGLAPGAGPHRAATYVDRVLRGTDPGQLPVEQPTRFELVVNLGTAAALGIRIPPAFVLRADRVIS